jgi:hypothetical protein
MSPPRHLAGLSTQEAVMKKLLIVTLLLVTGACASTSGRVYVRVAPPAAPIERRIAAPGPDFVWQPGYYRWNGRDYVWVEGRYERRPHARATWVAGHWAKARGGWYWVDGRWR